MRVERTSAGRGVASTKKPAAPSSGGSFASAIGRAGGTAAAESASPVSSVGPLTGVDALVALQAVDGDRAGRKRARERASSILDSLDELRLALLEGRLTEAQLTRLAARVQSQRAEIDDPRLSAVLDEIDLRAQVELAKYQQQR